MKKRRNWKRGMAAATAICLASASFLGLAGCKDKGEEAGDSGASLDISPSAGAQERAMGRYLEEDVNLPEGCQSVEVLKILDDGTMRAAYRDSKYKLYVADSKDGGETWGKGVSVADTVGMDSEDEWGVSCPSLAGDGGIFAASTKKLGDNMDAGVETHCFYISPDGKGQEVEVAEEIKGSYGIHSKFTEKGTVLLMSIGDGIKEINIKDGTLAASYEKGSSVESFGVAGNRLMVILNGSIHYYDLDTGKPLEDAAALSEQISSNPRNMELYSTSSFSLLFTQGDEKDSLFYVDEDGMYRYAFGGSVVEKIIDGSLNSIGSPDTQFVDFARDGEGNFYIAMLDEGSSTGGGLPGKILKYVYSKDTPSVPETELKVYSLRESSVMRQAAAVFQKKYPDIYLNLETGMTGEDAVTSTDALKTLNTEIMAGKGPDILILDGIPEDTYIEKGMLEDLSGVLKDVEILENIKEAYVKEDGAIYCMPLKFGIPVLMGKEPDVANITDLKSMADVVESHKAEYTENHFPVQTAMFPELLLKSMADVCAPAWMEDGTLDETAVKEYLEQINRIYQPCKENAEKLMEGYGEYGETMAGEYTREDYAIAGQGSSMLAGFAAAGVGGMYSPGDLATVDSVRKKDTSLTYQLWDGQAKNCFLPVQIAGISAKSEEKEAAEKFIQFLFSQDGQEIGGQSGLPVNKTVYEDKEYWNVGNSEGLVCSMSSENTETGERIELDVTQPSEEVVDEIQELGETLTVPVAVNEIILNAVSSAGAKYLRGEATLDEASAAVIQEVNLYLSE